MVVLGYALLFGVLVLFAASVRAENSGGRIVATPFNLYGSFYLLSSAAAPFTLYHSGYTSDLWAIVVVLIGFLACELGFLLFLRCRNLARAFSELPVESNLQSISLVVAVISTTATMLLISWIHFRGLPPLLLILKDIAFGAAPASDVDSALKFERFTLTKSHYFGGEYRGQGLTGDILRVGWTYILSVVLIQRHIVGSLLWNSLAVLLLPLAACTLAGAGVRWNVVLLAVALLCLYTYIRRIRLATVIVFAATAMLILQIVSVAIGKGFSQENPLVRALLGDGVHTVQIIELIDKGDLSYRYGAIQLQKALNCIPGIHSGEPFSAEVSRHVSTASRGTFASPTFVGVVYADFGFPGVLVTYLVIGACLSLGTMPFYFRRKTVLHLTLLVCVLSFMPGFALSGFTGLLPLLIVLGIFHLAFRLCLGLAQAVRGAPTFEESTAVTR